MTPSLAIENTHVDNHIQAVYASRDANRYNDDNSYHNTTISIANFASDSDDDSLTSRSNLQSNTLIENAEASNQ